MYETFLKKKNYLRKSFQQGIKTWCNWVTGMTHDLDALFLSSYERPRNQGLRLPKGPYESAGSAKSLREKPFFSQERNWGENKMAEEKVDVEYISLHGYIRNTPSDTEVLAKQKMRADRSAWPEEKNISVQFSHSVMSNSFRPHESQHARPPCPSPTPRVHSDSHHLS